MSCLLSDFVDFLHALHRGLAKSEVCSSNFGLLFLLLGLAEVRDLRDPLLEFLLLLSELLLLLLPQLRPLLVDTHVALLDYGSLCLISLVSLSLGSCSLSFDSLALRPIRLNIPLMAQFHLLFEFLQSLILLILLFRFFQKDLWLAGLISHKRDLLDYHSIVAHFLELLRSAKTTAKWEIGLFVVGTAHWMRDSERAVPTIAIPNLDLVVGWCTVLFVASVAEVVSTEAVPECN